MNRMPAPLRILAGTAVVLALAEMNIALAATLADSRAEFSGVQGSNSWYWGYRNVPYGGSTNYDPAIDFIPFAGGEGQGAWDGWFQTWTNNAWDLNVAAAAPWTYMDREALHPNGFNSGEEHWAIRRWVASELTADTWLGVQWNVRKQNISPGSGGVTGALHLNGALQQSAAIAGGDGVGVTQTYWVIAKPTDIFDLILSPVGPTGDTGDGADGSYDWMVVTSTTDSDADGLPDAWEEIYFPGDLTKLSANGDYDGDGLKDLAEMQRGTDPTKRDTDGDGLSDNVETGTGIYVSPADTGTNPLKTDTDGDGRTDGDEINVAPTTNPTNPDTDGDGFSDGSEVASGHNPNDPNNNPNTTWIANSRLEFSTDGSQGYLDWFWGYRNFSGDGGGINYNADSAFIPFGIESWTGSGWDLALGTSPWTEMFAESMHPAGASPTHWPIRRWVAAELTNKTPLAIRWHTRKTNLSCGSGVTGALYINGQRVDSAIVAYNDGVGVTHTFYANVDVGAKIDLILSPRGADNSDQDACDGSANWMVIDPTIPPHPVQPDGSVFIPVGAGDTDADGMPDAWEQIYFPGDLTKLSANGDFDGDGLKDPAEYARESDPTKPDTDGDGLSDLVETATGIYVSPTNTGSSPKQTDTDGDGMSDYEEVTRVPPTDPNKADTDGDGFTDPAEIAWGTDPLNPADNPLSQVIANSEREFSGVQGQDGWYNGYRVYVDGVSTTDYDPNTDFVQFDSWMWTGAVWDIDSGGAAPWTTAGPLDVHPNGVNNTEGGFNYNQEQWQIRRWAATEVTQVTPVAIIWHVHKVNPNGTGVTGSLHVNGIQVDHLTLAGNDGTGQIRRYYLNLKSTDIIDLALTPVGPTGDRGDGADGSITWFWVDKRILKEPRQPDGTLFIPAGAPDTDADGLLDFWELMYAPNLTVLTGTGDNDGDGLKNTDEFARDSSPLLSDTDGDGLPDVVESNTGTFVNAGNTGSNPRKTDTDGDGISDAAEVNRIPPTDPNKADTDGDGYSDSYEMSWGSDPVNGNDTPLTLIVANSETQFSGIQGANGWYGGYRIFNPLAGSIDYNPNQDFILFPGGEGQGLWDGVLQTWDNGAWHLNTGAAGPWTMLGPLLAHPNGTNSPPTIGGTPDVTKEHWTIRRWVAGVLTSNTQSTVIWQVRKNNNANDGVSGLLFVNGKLADSKAITGADMTGEVRRYRVVLKPNDIVDLALSPVGLNGLRNDWSDESATWFWVDTRPWPVVDINLTAASLNIAEGKFTFSWNSSPGVNYIVSYSANLKDWTPLPVVPSGGLTTTFTHDLGSPVPNPRFYRVAPQ